MVQISSLLAVGILTLSVAASPIAPAAKGHATTKTPATSGASHAAPPKVALPNHMKGLPAGSHALAFDEEKGEIHAFDANMNKLGSVKAVLKGGKPVVATPAKADSKGGETSTGASHSAKASAGSHKSGTEKAPPSKMLRQKRYSQKRDASACSPLSKDDVEKLHGWKDLKAAAEKAWGHKKYKVVTNDDKFPDYPATGCVDSAQSAIKVDGKPSCSSVQSVLKGSLSNDGTSSVTHQFGTTYENSLTVTKESSMSVGSSFTTTFGLPGVESGSGTVSFSATMSNTLAKGSSTTASTMESHTVTMSSKGGQACSLNLTTKTCQINGKGKVRVTADGWVWFMYDSKTKGHYKWALNIATNVKNIEDRSSDIEYRSQVSAKSSTDYKGTCKVVNDRKK